MVSLRLLAVLTILCVGSISQQAGLAQMEADPKQEATNLRLQAFLDRVRIETKPLQAEMPLAKFLEIVRQQLPKDSKISIGIDEDGFGAKAAAVAATPMRLPPSPKTLSLRRVLELVIGTIKIPSDYGLGAAGVTITTPERARYTASYDIRQIVAKPDQGWFADVERVKVTQRVKGAQVVQDIVSTLDPSRPLPKADLDSMRILNGDQFQIRTGAAHHAEINDWVTAFHRLGDVAVVAKARLYEVDAAFHTKLKSLKRLSLEELEKQFFEGQAGNQDALFKLLEKQKLLLTGAQINVDSGRTTALLSQYQVVSCLPKPAPFDKENKVKQLPLVGVGFEGEIRVSPDRRSMRVQLSEKAAEIQEIRKIKVWDPTFMGDVLPPQPRKFWEAEEVFLQSSSHTQILEIPDGAAILVPVHYRPAEVQAKQRFWVLRIDATIVIEEEEKAEHSAAMTDILPIVVADILKNPRLQSTRDFFGSPADKRFTLVDSSTWAWPEKSRIDVAGFQWTAAKRQGQRLLGIRVDHYEPTTHGITVTLVNAGGSANGAVIGGCTIRYTAHKTDEDWVVELSSSDEH